MGTLIGVRLTILTLVGIGIIATNVSAQQFRDCEKYCNIFCGDVPSNEVGRCLEAKTECDCKAHTGTDTAMILAIVLAVPLSILIVICVCLIQIKARIRHRNLLADRVAVVPSGHGRMGERHSVVSVLPENYSNSGPSAPPANPVRGQDPVTVDLSQAPPSYSEAVDLQPPPGWTDTFNYYNSNSKPI